MKNMRNRLLLLINGMMNKYKQNMCWIRLISISVNKKKLSKGIFYV